MVLNMEFFNHVFVLLGLMVGFTAFRVASCKPFKEDGEDFSWKKLFLGTLKHLIVIFGACVVFVISSNFGSNLFLIQMGETQVTLQSAIDITTLSILAIYGVKYINNLAEYAGIKESMPSTKEILPDFNVSTEEVEGKG